MKHFAALALFLFSASVTAQIEHAPTVAQCQADQRLWLSQMQTNDPLPSFREMHQRNTEMDNCKRVHPANNVAYYNASAEIQSEQLNRLVDFVDRHNL